MRQGRVPSLILKVRYLPSSVSTSSLLMSVGPLSSRNVKWKVLDTVLLAPPKLRYKNEALNNQGLSF